LKKLDMTRKPDHLLDITSEVCPMTFVKTRLLIEKMASGETALIRLTGEEPIGNVPASVKELGHAVVSMVREDGAPAPDPTAIHLLTIRKAPD
jgi:TusA-related sulfurtransferase